MKYPKVPVIIQARYSSTRFPGKILRKINNKTILEILINRLHRSKNISKIIVACSNNRKDKMIVNLCKAIGVKFFCGPETNVLKRYYLAAKKFNCKHVIRITSDCPLIDSDILDKLVNNFFKNNADYASNTYPPTYPDGLDLEIFKFENLEQAFKNSKSNYDREHVTPYIKKRAKNLYNLRYSSDYSWMRLTLDERDDFKLIKKIVSNFKSKKYFSFQDILKFYKKNKNLFLINIGLKRNEGEKMIKGQKMWKRAKSVIPGGTMLFSKNPDLFLPDKWPAYFIKSKGCKIWDLDSKIYFDLSFMGVGTNSLGYNHPEIERAVIKTIKDGNMTTLNSTEEIQLAERLIDLHPWSDMARFTRSGGEANSVAIRIARSASGKDNVAICGYHGWHDWYLSSNLTNQKNLDSHLMRNTPYLGVPKNLKNSCFPFDYNNFSQLKELVEKKNIGVIKMEVQRNIEPQNNFLKKVRKLATNKNIVLIFDECTSGFRQTFGGLHKFYDIEPDIAIFGKALGNGHAINAIIGKKSVMEHAKSTFISSTFWTERTGPSAALATLNVMEKTKSWNTITKIGKRIKKNWKKIADSNKIKINIQGIDALPNFTFNYENNLKYKTFISQEMLKKKILASNAVYCSLAHKENLLNNYFYFFNDILNKISKFENGSIDIQNYLKSKTCISGIRDSKKN